MLTLTAAPLISSTSRLMTGVSWSGEPTWSTNATSTEDRARKRSGRLRSLQTIRYMPGANVRVPACQAIARAASEGWWGRQDSNLRSHKAADLQSAPFATRDTPPLDGSTIGPDLAGDRRRPWNVKAATARMGARPGAVIGEAVGQSQPRRTAKIARPGVQIAIFGDP